MSSKSKPQVKRPAKSTPSRRSPRTLKVDKQQLPALIPESFNLKNFDVVGRIDDMRALTKELSIMARQLEQWVGIIYTLSMAFKDNGILKELLKAISSIGNQMQGNEEASRPGNQQKQKPPLLPPFPFFGNDQNQNEQNFRRGDENQTNNPFQFPNQNQSQNQNKKPFEGINIFEIISNPAFQDIMSKLFLQKKK